jgi:hypothetical protein
MCGNGKPRAGGVLAIPFLGDPCEAGVLDPPKSSLPPPQFRGYPGEETVKRRFWKGILRREEVKG